MSTPGAGPRDHHIRLGLRFMKTHPTWLRSSLAERGLFDGLSELCLTELREFLPAEYTLENIALLLHEKACDIRKAFAKMLARPDPLVGRLDDGRIRVFGVRLKHGLRLPWKDEAEALGQWHQQHPDQVGRGSDAGFPPADKPGQAGTSRRKPARPGATAARPGQVSATSRGIAPPARADVDVDVRPGQTKSLPLAETLPSLRDCGLDPAARQAAAGIMEAWEAQHRDGFTPWPALDEALRYRLAGNEPKRLVAHVFDVGQTRHPTNLFALLLKRIGTATGWKMEPSDGGAWAFARKAISGRAT